MSCRLLGAAIVGCLLGVCHGYPGGAGSCGATPGHGGQSKASNTYTLGSVGDIEVTDRAASLSLQGPAGSFKGFLVVAKSGKGQFSVGAGAQAKSCSSPAITQKRGSYSKVDFVYTLDASETEIELEVTVVISYSQYMTFTQKVKLAAAPTKTPTKTPTKAEAPGAEVCFEGYVMDKYCINRGTLLDNSALKTLMHPDKHTVHCLVDPEICYNSGFELLADPVEDLGAYCRAYELDSAGNAEVLSLARSTGSKSGCNTCTNTATGALTKGFRATITGTVSDGSTSPPTLAVTKVEAAGVGCPNGFTEPSHCIHHKQALTLAPTKAPTVTGATLSPSTAPTKTPTKAEPTSSKCSAGCSQWFDGCNTCKCNADGSLSACTEMACATYEKPLCSDAAPDKTKIVKPVVFKGRAGAEALELAEGVTMEWVTTKTQRRKLADANTIELAMRVVDTKGWLSLGFSTDGLMVGGKAVVFRPDLATANQVQVNDLVSKSPSGVQPVTAACPDITSMKQLVTDSSSTLQFTIDGTVTNGCLSTVFTASGSNNVIWAIGDKSSSAFTFHSMWSMDKVQVNFLTGTTSIAAFSYTNLKIHAWLMTIGWGVLIPLGIIVARFLKGRPPKGWWYKMHRAIQSTGLLFAIIGTALAIQSVSDRKGEHFSGRNSNHKLIGLIVMILGIQQPVFAILRPHTPEPGEDKSGTRAVWEMLHKGSGYVAVGLAAVAIFLGLDALASLSGEGGRGKIIYAVILALLGLTFIGLQISGKAKIEKEPVSVHMKANEFNEKNPMKANSALGAVALEPAPKSLPE